MSRLFRHALEQLTARVSDTESAVGHRFPIYSDPETGQWVSSRRGSWVAGFWVGQLWLRALLSGDAGHLDAAEAALRRLQPAIELDTAARGLMFWYGAAAGEELSLSATGGAIAREAAERLAATVDPETAILLWGTGFGDPPRPLVARIDGLAGAVPLLAWAGESEIATRFLRTLLAHCQTSAGLIPAMEFTAGQWIPRPEPPAGWPRGTAWLLLATADAGHWLDPQFTASADEILSRTPHFTDIPTVATPTGAVPDTSAAAIIAVALCKLGRTADASALVEILIRTHLSGGDRPGRLLDGCYDGAQGVATAHELIWGDFFLMLALAILEGEVEATTL